MTTAYERPATFEAALNRYASGCNSTGTDKVTSHSYGKLYTALMAPLRDTARRVLEVGVYSGASVLALADFFEGARVDGADITLDRVRFGLEHPRVFYHRLDGTRPESADALMKACPDRFDVVLDDASHLPEHQAATARLFAPLLSPGGVLIIEDIAGGVGSEFLRLQLQALCDASAGELALEWHDLRFVKGQFDDIVAVLHKRA
jgi:predicted O-methyltransferase YrrM